MSEVILEAAEENPDKVLQFVDEQLEKVYCPVGGFNDSGRRNR